jgi:hypothetical protein
MNCAGSKGRGFEFQVSSFGFTTQSSIAPWGRATIEAALSNSHEKAQKTQKEKPGIVFILLFSGAGNSTAAEAEHGFSSCLAPFVPFCGYYLAQLQSSPFLTALYLLER